MGCRDGSFEDYEYAIAHTEPLTRFICRGWACPNFIDSLDKTNCQATQVGDKPQNDRCGLEVQAVQSALRDLRNRAELLRPDFAKVGTQFVPTSPILTGGEL